MTQQRDEEKRARDPCESIARPKSNACALDTPVAASLAKKNSRPKPRDAVLPSRYFESCQPPVGRMPSNPFWEIWFLRLEPARQMCRGLTLRRSYAIRAWEY